MTPLAWVKLGLVLAAFGVVIGFGWKVHSWKEDAAKLPKVAAALEAEQKCLEESECGKRVAAEKARVQEITQMEFNRYESEIAALNSRPIPTRVIRVCNDGNVRVAGGAEGASSSASGELLLGQDELDTRPLREAAKLADEINAAYRFLYTRDTALADGAVDVSN